MTTFMKFSGYIFVFLVLIAFACSKSEITPPPTGDDANLAGTSPIPFTGLTTIKSLEGIYELESGSEGLGTQFVCKVSKYKVSFFSNTSAGTSPFTDRAIPTLVPDTMDWP